MKKLINEIIFGKNSMVSGLIALSIILAIGLGCFCNKDKFNVANVGSSSPTPSASPSPSATKSYKKADASKLEIPSDDELQDIVKKTLLDFNDALQKKDFSDFHSTISKPWQKSVTPAELKNTFQSFIDGEADLSSIRSMNAKFTSPTEITRSTGLKTLETKGEYPTTPNTSTFELKYIIEGKEWKLSGLKVYTNVKKRY
jgi:hypothetical protein